MGWEFPWIFIRLSETCQVKGFDSAPRHQRKTFDALCYGAGGKPSTQSYWKKDHGSTPQPSKQTTSPRRPDKKTYKQHRPAYLNQATKIQNNFHPITYTQITATQTIPNCNAIISTMISLFFSNQPKPNQQLPIPHLFLIPPSSQRNQN